MPGHDGQTGFNRFGDKSYLMTALRLAGRSLPGDYVRTFVYLNLIYKPRLALRRLVSTFYRMDHVYAVIGEFKRAYKGPFSILEFGVADGYAFAKKAYATRYLGMEDSIVCHGFDSFEGLPEEVGPWTKADFDLGGRIPSIDDPRVRFYKGWFSDVLPHYQVPAHDVLVMNMDADIYSSTAYVLRHFRPWIKQGTYIYFDEFNHVDQEPRAFHELIESGFRFRLVSTDSTLAFSCFQCTQTAS